MNRTVPATAVLTRVSVAGNGCGNASNGQRTVVAPEDYPDRYGG